MSASTALSRALPGCRFKQADFRGNEGGLAMSAKLLQVCSLLTCEDAARQADGPCDLRPQIAGCAKHVHLRRSAAYPQW